MTAIKFPNEAFDYIEQRGLVWKAVSYVIDWRYRKAINLSIWLEPQVMSIKQHPQIKQLIEENQSIKGNYNALAIAALRWVRKNFKYVGDKQTWNVEEKWQTALESLDLKHGDCEDGAILMYCICRLLGIPSNRLLLFAGDVEGGGHCWLGYKPEEDPTKLVFLDWCYWYNNNIVYNRPLFWFVGNNVYGQDKRYKTMWFAFNETSGYTSFKPTVL